MRSATKHDIFAEDIRKGLSANPKTLSSKYFYDDEGSKLFQQIMDLDEYYPTRTELEIFQTQTAEIFEAFTKNSAEFDLVELGAGDGTKTAILTEYFLRAKANFTYAPIDISQEAVDSLTVKFAASFPELRIKPKTGDYFQILESLKTESERPKILLFLGSNIGNFSHAQSLDFFKGLHSVMNKDDLLFIGFDLQKNPRTILAAYDDKSGVTAEFNLNLLRRINRELGANFDLENFSHYATYHPIDGAARSFLISRITQDVFIESLNQTFKFKAWEPIFVEISQKYTWEIIENLAHSSNFEVLENFSDSKCYFVDSLWKVS